MSARFLLYTAKVCPYPARAELALEEVGANWERYDIDLRNKPYWYAEKVNKASKGKHMAPLLTTYGFVVVPVLVDGDFKLPESLVITEYLADLYLEKGILPRDPKKRSQARYLTERYSQLVTPHYIDALLRQQPEAVGKLSQGLKESKELFPNQGPYLLGETFSLVVMAIAPFVARILSISRNSLVPNRPRNL